MTPSMASLASSASHLSFPSDNSLRDASIIFKLYKGVKHRTIQVQLNMGVFGKVLSEI